MLIVRLAASFFFLIALATALRAEEKLVLSSGMHEPWTNEAGTGFTNLFIAELFARLGMKAEVRFNPAAARALQLAEAGIDDGLAARMDGLEKDFPDLIRVPEVFFVNDFVAAGLTPPPVTKWADLSPLSVSYILGWQVFDRNVPAVRELTLAKDSKQLFGLLRARRVDVILHERRQAQWLAGKRGLALQIAEPPLASAKMYIYLNKRRADLVPRVAAALAAMKAEGRDEAIMRQTFGRLDVSR